MSLMTLNAHTQVVIIIVFLLSGPDERGLPGCADWSASARNVTRVDFHLSARRGGFPPKRCVQRMNAYQPLALSHVRDDTHAYVRLLCGTGWFDEVGAICLSLFTWGFPTALCMVFVPASHLTEAPVSEFNATPYTSSCFRDI